MEDEEDVDSKCRLPNVQLSSDAFFSIEMYLMSVAFQWNL